MKKLLALSLLAVLSIGLLSVGVPAAQVSDDTHVSWYYTCNANIDAHTPINEGQIGPGTSGYINFNNGNSSRVTTWSNCPYELTVDGAANTYPAGTSNLLGNFDLNFTGKTVGTWLSPASTGWFPLTSGTRSVGAVSLSDADGSPHNWDVEYRFDASGQPAGQYQVDLTYTLTTT